MKIQDKIIISSYKRSINISKILSFLGMLLILCLIYKNSNIINNNLPLTQSNSDHNSFQLNDLEPDCDIKVSNSIFTGLNKDLNQYQIQAVQTIKTLGNKYTLKEINAKYKISDDKELVVNAKNGILTENTQILELEHNVEFLLSGMILQAQNAQLNIINREAFGQSDVALSYKNSKITSNSFSSTNNNDIINFKGRVSTIIDMSDFSDE